MELFLNLCWVALLLPAFLVWRQRTLSPAPVRKRIFLFTLGCALVLLFPVISASDDVYAMRPAVEESETALRNDGHSAGTLHSVNHSSLTSIFVSDSSKVVFEQVGNVLAFSPRSLGTLFSHAPSGRAPPSQRPVSL